MTDCTQRPDGLVCEEQSSWVGCRPWDITNQPRTNCYADGLIQESLDIAGAKINVYKLLGVHEQTKLVDLIGNGTAISGGDMPGFPASNAFDTFKSEWRSKQTGSAIFPSTYIGYDFGYIKIPTGRQRYGINANIRQHITAINIKQSSNPAYRVTKARVERSDNGGQWYGVAIINLPNDDNLNTIYFKQSVPNRYWRLRPLEFVGTDCDSWGIQAFEMYDFSLTATDNIQDKILLENRDRDYQNTATLLKGYYDLINVATDLTRFGIEIPTATYQIRVNFNACVEKLGRPIVIGDIIELPSETQYTPQLKPIKRWLEVSDVTWDTNYTPGWMPVMLLVTAQPALASQETQDIFGDLAKNVDDSGLFDTDDGNNQIYQDISTIDQTIAADANTQVPERGSEGSNVIREFSDAEKTAADVQGFPHLKGTGFNRVGLYVEDALPQNDAPYTEGTDFPPSPKDGDYHRLIFAGTAADIPARLYRWSTIKGRWVYLETDRRELYNNQKALLEEYVTSKTKKWSKDIK